MVGSKTTLILKSLLSVHQNLNFFKTFGHLLISKQTLFWYSKAFKHYWHLEERIFTRALSCVGSRLNCDYHPTCLNVRFALSGLSWLWLCWLGHPGLFLSCTQTNCEGAFSNNIGKTKCCACNVHEIYWDMVLAVLGTKMWFLYYRVNNFSCFMYILHPSQTMEEPKKKPKLRRKWAMVLTNRSFVWQSGDALI